MTLPLAGWYPDPENVQRWRWWNGNAWTENYSDPHPAAPAAAAAPMAVATPAAQMNAAPYSYSANTATLTAPAGTEWNTVWIWLIVLMPVVSIFSIFAIDVRSMFSADIMNDPTAMMFAIYTPGYFVILALGWIIYALSVWFSYLDWRELGRRGVPRPFHWAWSFLQSGVYPIGRSVIARRRIGRGISPMWVTIGVLVLSFIVVTVWMVYFFFTLFDQLGPLLS